MGNWSAITNSGDITLLLGGLGDAHITHWPSPISLPERKANAYLIAAAPALYEALRELYEARFDVAGTPRQEIAFRETAKALALVEKGN